MVKVFLLYMILFCIDKNYMIIYLSILVNFKYACFNDGHGTSSFFITLIFASFILIMLVIKFRQ